MTATRTSISRRMAIVMAASLLAHGAVQVPAFALTRPRPEEIRRLARELESAPRPLDDDDDRADTTPPPTQGDPDRPVVGFRIAIAELDRLRAAHPPNAAPALHQATDRLRAAWRHFAAGSRDLSHLAATAAAVRDAQAALQTAAMQGPSSGAASLEPVRARLARISRRMASDVLLVADRAGAKVAEAKSRLALGDLAARQRQYVLASTHFGGGLTLAANTITFDVARFEQNIKDGLNGQTTGHAFSIAFRGLLYQGGESAGSARTAANPAAAPQSPSKEMHVASVSKTLTTIVVLRLLEELGLTPDAVIAPYLPADWAMGDGVEALRFRDFMTHTSGFGQINAGGSYDALRTAIATDVGSTSFSYKNANFGLMRVLVPGLLGHELGDFDDIDPDFVSTAIFLLYAAGLYQEIGVSVDCRPNDNAPTVQYKFPDDGTPGYVEPDRRSTCGGYGWFISSNELASVLTHLRNTEDLLSASMRETMQEQFLGFMDPANYGFIGGTFGVYSMHGGDWFHSAGELHSCAITFPITVEAALVINSERGAMPSQCDLLQTAFDAAWVAD